MQVRFFRTVSGPHGTWSAGQTADLPRAFAYSLIEAGAAEQVGEDPEAATVDGAETATGAPQRRRRG